MAERSTEWVSDALRAKSKPLEYIMSSMCQLNPLFPYGRRGIFFVGKNKYRWGIDKW